MDLASEGDRIEGEGSCVQSELLCCVYITCSRTRPVSKKRG